ncbi:MAG: hypothetical protein IJO19_05415 [Clostridia bacterium]|nr:hypothetical protein [Clostridia bacterium]
MQKTGENMTRKEFCERIAKKQKVKYDGSLYLPVRYMIGFDDKNNNWVHSVEIKDLKHYNSVIVAPLERIEDDIL